jgi:hypothetical protein
MADRQKRSQKSKEIPDRDLNYIKNPLMWVSMVCPLKRPDPNGIGNQCAYMTGGEPVIRYGNVFMMSLGDREERFESYEAIIAAGWKVD